MAISKGYQRLPKYYRGIHGNGIPKEVEISGGPGIKVKESCFFCPGNVTVMTNIVKFK